MFNSRKGFGSKCLETWFRREVARKRGDDMLRRGWRRLFTAKRRKRGAANIPVFGDLRLEKRRRGEHEKWYKVSIGVRMRPVRRLFGGADESDTKINVANRCFEEIWWCN